jgi:hypothetical protein
MCDISLLLPARNVKERLVKNITQIFSLAHNPSNIEILIRFDEDDNESKIFFDNSEITSQYNIKVFVGVRYGYIGIFNYFNELAGHACGKYFLTFNDDCVITTKNWDQEILNPGDEIVVMHPVLSLEGVISNDNQIPIISRKVYDLAGGYPPNAHVDTFFDRLASDCGIAKRINVEIQHLRGARNPDRDQTHPDFFSINIQSILENAKNNIKQYLGR